MDASARGVLSAESGPVDLPKTWALTRVPVGLQPVVMPVVYVYAVQAVTLQLLSL